MPPMPKPLPARRSPQAADEAAAGRTSRGIQSVEVGGQLLKALVRFELEAGPA